MSASTRRGSPTARITWSSRFSTRRATRAPVLDREITVANPAAPAAPGPPNGANASAAATLAVRWSRTKRASLTIGYGRPCSVSGRLTAPGGVPIAGAAGRSARARVIHGCQAGPARHAENGRRRTLRAEAGAGTCRRAACAFSTRAHIGDAAPAVTRTLRLSVRAALRLQHLAAHSRGRAEHLTSPAACSAAPCRATASSSFSRRARRAGRGSSSRSCAAIARGRYRAGYRFKFAGPATYQFRVRSEVESDYPFAAGSSRGADRQRALGAAARPSRRTAGRPSTTLRCCEGRDPRRRTGLATQRGDRRAPQADGRDRRQADAVAHHEDLRRPRHRGLRHLPRLQGLPDQGVLRQLLPAHVRRVVRPGQRRHGDPPLRHRAVARHARRHRRALDDRRPAEARAALPRRRGLLLHLRRRASPTSTSAR